MWTSRPRPLADEAGVGRAAVAAAVAGLVLAVAVAGLFLFSGGGPQPGSPEYERAVRAFFRGLAALDVGLLDDARDRFAEVTKAAPAEPAGWANLGLAQLRLGEVDAAAPAVARALDPAPNRADVLILSARVASAQGRVEDGIALLRRAAGAETGELRARFALVEEIERSGAGEGGSDVPQLLDDLVEAAPTNLAVLVERARNAATRRDAVRAQDSVQRLEALAGGWPPLASEQLAGLRAAVTGASWPDATRAAALLRNVLARVPAFSEGLAAVRTPAELVGAPLRVFATLPAPDPRPADADTALTYTPESVGPASTGDATVLALFSSAASAPTVVVADAVALTRMDQSGDALASWPAGQVTGALSLDWNHDFRQDVAVWGPGGVGLWLQNEDGTFGRRVPSAAFPAGVTGAWAADVEMDGDIDIVVGVPGAPVAVLRNHGDGSWQTSAALAAVSDARAFAWADLDGDADPDAAVADGAGVLHVLLNRQAGTFVADTGVPSLGDVVDLTASDLDADGGLDVVSFAVDGSVRTASRHDGRWTSATIAAWTTSQPIERGRARLIVADLDNNGALDVLASASSASRVWLRGSADLTALQSANVEGYVARALDVTGDGVLDLVGRIGSQPTRWAGRTARGYRSKTIRVRAQQNAGDQRINSFGLGGDIEVRSGLWWQKQPITDAVVHVGLGTAATIDVARIVWPNGVPQAEFDVSLDGPLVAEQRLKGSCPWVFAYDGTQMTFVTDFLWRSPLGLRINAIDTAGVTQTEDWVRIRGDQLQASEGTYDIRITAELWETHFFDHVSLMAVDHPVSTEVFVDERFMATRPQARVVYGIDGLAPVVRGVDERGRDVTREIAAVDGRFVASFARGRYQGIAADEHYVEVELASPVVPGEALIAQGWVYPTDSSINVAIGQAVAQPSRAVALEAQVAGTWRVVEPDIGFPAGKNKTLVVDLAKAAGARRVRLRTRLEVYWDAMRVGRVARAEPRATPLELSTATLRFRGFSKTVSPRGDAPETPTYAPVANVTQQWRDLEGYYTRFGDVRALLAGVDDRYVIMNAGDELQLRFVAPPPPRAGWRRDFVLVGDGWEKDGDFNTGHSQTVVPLPEHRTPDYGARVGSGRLEDDPVYRRHAADWVEFHTRYVAPDVFLHGLRPAARVRP